MKQTCDLPTPSEIQAEITGLIPRELPFGICAFSRIANRLLDCRKRGQIPENAKSVLLLLFPYLLDEEIYRHANVSRYAVSADYHTIVGAYLDELIEKLRKAAPGFSFAAFCDNSPIPEVYAAALSGLGVIGRNGLLIHPVYGSYCFIGEVVTDLALTPTGNCVKGCPGCGTCEKACPSGALSGGKPEEKICLSAVTQQKKELSPEQALLIRKQGLAWGCDRCQTVCPLNQNARTTPLAPFWETALPLVTVQTPVEGRAYAWRGEKVIRRNLYLLEKIDNR